MDLLLAKLESLSEDAEIIPELIEDGFTNEAQLVINQISRRYKKIKDELELVEDIITAHEKLLNNISEVEKAYEQR